MVFEEAAQIRVDFKEAIVEHGRRIAGDWLHHCEAILDQTDFGAGQRSIDYVIHSGCLNVHYMFLGSRACHYTSPPSIRRFRRYLNIDVAELTL